ncbi:hypothetical protein Tco_0302754 [Tanacetum coccineum]
MHFERYAYSIDDHVNQEEDDPMIKIIGGPVAMAFLNNFLEVVLNRNANDLENPLVHYALECKLSSSLFLPIFNCHPSSEIKHASCVDVIECSAMRMGSGLVRVLNELKSGLERVGLNMFHVQQFQPYKTIPSLKRARDEIEEALAVVSSSLRDTQMEQTFAVKLFGYHSVFDDKDISSSITPYHDTCDMFPLKMGEGLVGKTLQTYKTHFYKNIGKLSDNRLLMFEADSSASGSCSNNCAKSPDIVSVMFKAEYGDDLIAFHLPVSSATMVAMEKQISDRFEAITTSRAPTDTYVDPREEVNELRRQVEILTERLTQLEHPYKKEEFELNDAFENLFHRHGRHHEQPMHRRWEASIKVEIPDFLGTLKVEEFVDWLNTVERVFEFKDVPENKKVKWVAIKLKGRASAWWEQL